MVACMLVRTVPRFPTPVARALLLAGLAAGLLLPACQSSAKSGTVGGLFETTGMSERELRAELGDFVLRFSGLLELAESQILETSDRPGLRDDLLQWKINATAASLSAAFDDDASIGLIELWVLILQMEQYLAEVSPLAEDVIQEVSTTTLDSARAQIEDIAQRFFLDDYEGVALDVQEWAQSHPLQDILLTRESAVPLLRSLAGERNRGLFASVESMEMRMEALSDQLRVLGALMPREVRWIAVQVVRDVFRHPELVRVWETLGLAQETLVQTNALLQDTPGLIQGEREAVLAFAREERLAAIEAIDAQRSSTLEFMREERIAVLAAMDGQRAALMQDMTGLTETAILQSGEQARDVFDHVLWRTFLFLAGLIVLGAVAAALVLRARGR